MIYQQTARNSVSITILRGHGSAFLDKNSKQNISTHAMQINSELLIIIMIIMYS